jgi:[protein-PII] uridylyltransferase
MLVTTSRKILFEPVDGQSARLLYTSQINETGILYRITGVLYIHGWSIDSAVVKTETMGGVDDIFSIHRLDNQPMEIATLERIEQDMEMLLRGEIHMSEYLSSYPERIQSLVHSLSDERDTKLDIEVSEDPTIASIYLETKDRPGILFMITQILFLLDYDILRFEASTQNGQARDDLDVRKNTGGSITERDRKQLITVLRNNL